MTISIGKLRGLSADLAAKFKAEGISDTDSLLTAANTTAARKALAAKLGVEASVVLEATNRADLARVQGVAGVFGHLLEEAGVDTVKELAARNPENLYAKLVAVNTETKIAGRQPYLAEVTGWVEQAKALPRKIEY